MKKLVSVLLILMLSVTLISCTKTENDNSKEGIKVYTHVYEEEIEGENLEFTTYVILKDDSFGYLIEQDIIPIKWDDKIILDYNNDIAYPYAIDGDKLTLEEMDMEIEYTLDNEALTDELIGIMNECDAREKE